MRDDISVVIARHADTIMGVPGVVGIGQGLEHGEACVHVLVAVPAATLMLPAVLDGYPVVVAETGPVRPLGGP